jgi:hypothetical protein
VRKSRETGAAGKCAPGFTAILPTSRGVWRARRAAFVAMAGNDASARRGVDREEVPVDTDGHA